MEKFLTEQDIKTLAASFSLEVPLIKTVLQIESSGSGFDKNTGLIKIQFEPHVFKKYTKILIINGVDIQKNEWVAFNAASKVDFNAALLSTSWGLGQIMGYNYKTAGYNSVEEMVDLFKRSEFHQFEGMLRFIKNNSAMYKALKEKNWDEFAKRYNGPAYKDFHYDTKLSKTYASLI